MFPIFHAFFSVNILGGTNFGFYVPPGVITHCFVLCSIYYNLWWQNKTEHGPNKLTERSICLCHGIAKKKENSTDIY